MSLSAGDVMHVVSQEQGWNTDTQLELALEYIDNQQANSAFEEFLRDKGVCRFCGVADCYCSCCKKAVDGKHVPDPKSATVPVGSENMIVDYRCKLCGDLGSVAVSPDEINWE